MARKSKEIQKYEQPSAPPVSVASEEVRAELEVQSQVLLAKKFPRDPGKAKDKILETCKRKRFADKALYSYPRGGAQITGPSINLAREMAVQYGNILTGMMIISDDEETRTIRGIAWDIENNVRVFFDDTFKKLIYRKDRGWIKPDERDLRELTNRRGAILIRNAILHLFPSDFVDEAVETCLKTQTRSPVSQRKIDKLVEAFARVGVSRNMLEEYAGKSLEDLSSEEYANLVNLGQAIKDGAVQRDEIFNQAGNEPEVKVEFKVEEKLFEENKIKEEKENG